MTDKYSALLTLAEEYNREHEDPIEIKQNEPMSRHTSFKIGGNADLYIIPHDMDALIETVRILKETETKRYFLGNATNAVSYTHLDVYKRQHISSKIIRRNRMNNNRRCN